MLKPDWDMNESIKETKFDKAGGIGCMVTDDVMVIFSDEEEALTSDSKQHRMQVMYDKLMDALTKVATRIKEVRRG